MNKTAVITGFNAGLSESLATLLLHRDFQVIGISRRGTFSGQFAETHKGFSAYTCDVSDEDQVKNCFSEIRKTHGNATVLIHNAAQLLLKDFLELKSEEFLSLWKTSCLGAVNVSKQVLPAMLENKNGTLIFSGATASVKAGPNSSAFSSAKFALRGLTQSLARAYGPKGIHVIHTVLDGVIWGERAQNAFQMQANKCMKAEEIATAYLSLIDQNRSAWTQELDVRPYCEKF